MAVKQSEYMQARYAVDDGTQLLQRSVYNAIIGGVVLWGVAIDVLMASYLKSAVLTLPYWAILVAYLVGSLGGRFIVYRSRRPVVSFLGFTLLSAAMGLVVTFFVSMYNVGTVSSAFLITGLVTVLMIVLSTAFPRFFLGIGRILAIALIATLVIDLVAMFLFRVNMTWVDAVIALIFAGYLGYDWARAQAFPATVDNAVDSAADIYIDIINLFIRLLNILGHSSSSKD